MDFVEVLDAALQQARPVVGIGLDELRHLFQLLGHDPRLDARPMAPGLELFLAQRNHRLVSPAGIAIKHDSEGLARDVSTGAMVGHQGLGRFLQRYLLEQHPLRKVRLAPQDVNRGLQLLGAQRLQRMGRPFTCGSRENICHDTPPRNWAIVSTLSPLRGRLLRGRR